MEATMGRHLKPLPCGKPEKLSRRAIRTLPLRVRQERYEKEKQELFFQIRDLSPEEVGRAHKALADKWQV